MQRNPYKGISPRCWVRIRFAAPDGSLHEHDLLADTGSPCAVILGQAELSKLFHASATSINSNFGALNGGWLSIEMPELGVTTQVLGFGSDQVLNTVQRDSPDFAGLIGLPLLRMMEYGGDAASFWLKNIGQPP
ncbi:MAG: hypothetical protein ACR2FY_05045 [Pirellulaceae bacterium]